MSRRPGPREIPNDELKKQLLAGTFTTTAKRRHLPLAYNLFRQDQLAIKNIAIRRGGKSEAYQRAAEAIRRKWDASQELQTKYNKIRSIIDGEIRSLREWELDMIRFGEKHPESMVINDASWHWQQDQYKFVHPRLRARNSQYQFVKSVKRFGANKSVQKVKFNELYNEWKSSDDSLKLLAFPMVGGRMVDLFELYRIIVIQGGMGRTLKKTIIWKDLGAQMRLSGTGDTLFYQLRIIYYKYLLSFEHKYQVTKERGDANKLKLKKTWIKPKEEDNIGYKYDFEYVTEARDDYIPYINDKHKKKRKKKKRKRRQRHVAMVSSIPFHSVYHEMSDYSSDDIYYLSRKNCNKKRKTVSRIEEKSHYKWNRKGVAVNHIDTHNVFGSNMDKYTDKYGYWNGMHFMEAIILSLKSRIQCNVNWGLNRLLFLSFNTKSEIAEPLSIKHHCNALLDALLDLMPYIDVNEFKSVDTGKDGNTNTMANQSLLSLDLSSHCFGHNKGLDLNALRSIRNDTNCVLHPATTRVILRILSNLALTGDNEQCMVDHGVFVPYLLEMVKRRDFIPSDCCYQDAHNDYTEIHVSALRVIAHLSQKISLTKWMKRSIASQQMKRYQDCIPTSTINFSHQRYKLNSLCFVQTLMHILSANLCISCVIDPKEYKHWILYYSLMICCHLAANPNNHGVLNEYIKYTIMDDDNDNNPIKYVDLSHVLSLNNIDTAHVMTFDDDDDDVKQNEYEWILRIIHHILSANAQIKLCSIEAVIYLFESNVNYTKYLFNHARLVKELIPHLVSIGTDKFYGQQLYRSSAYLLSLLYKQCGADHSDLFADCNNHIFEACAQYDDFACYAIHLTRLKQHQAN